MADRRSDATLLPRWSGDPWYGDPSRTKRPLDRDATARVVVDGRELIMSLQAIFTLMLARLAVISMTGANISDIDGTPDRKRR